MNDLLTLADTVPGFLDVLADALSVADLNAMRQQIEAGAVTSASALAALANHAINLNRELILAGEDIIDRTGTVKDLEEYRAAHGLGSARKACGH
jgi:hypothetical protein